MIADHVLFAAVRYIALNEDDLKADFEEAGLNYNQEQIDDRLGHLLDADDAEELPSDPISHAVLELVDTEDEQEGADEEDVEGEDDEGAEVVAAARALVPRATLAALIEDDEEEEQEEEDQKTPALFSMKGSMGVKHKKYYKK